MSSSGRDYANRTDSLTVGPNGPILLQDVRLIEEMARFNRERIPERVVHAKGAGAFGKFVLEHPELVAPLCKASIFNEPAGSQTEIAIRFSTVGGERGSADTVRDPRGFAVKFYTKQGNWDLVCNNTPIFFIRDPMLFPSLVHSQKRNPQTNLRDPNCFWDFLSQRPESMHQVCILFSDRGLPDGYRHMHGYSGHAYKMVSKTGAVTYAKFHLKCRQPIKNLTSADATRLAGVDPDYSTRDLFEAIAQRQYPKWTFCIQTMSEEQAKASSVNPFDITRVWPQREFPLTEIGYIELNRNPMNNFAEIEQLAFCPGNMVPGIEASPDRILQGRLFAYTDAQRYRLGVNFHQLPVNRCINQVQNLTYRDGFGCFGPNDFNKPNYYPNRQAISVDTKQNQQEDNDDGQFEDHRFELCGVVGRHHQGSPGGLALKDSASFYEQASDFVNRVIDDKSRMRMADNLGYQMKLVDGDIRDRMMAHLQQVSPQLASMVKASLLRLSQ